MSSAVITRKVSWKSVALPAEHGGWGFTLEPIFLGILAAPSAALPWLGVSALSLFLSRHPLRLVLGDLKRRKWFPRTNQALQMALLYGTVTFTSLGIAAITSRAPFWLPLILALPLALVHLYLDLQGKAKALIPEIMGATAMAAWAPAIALAAGWEPLNALGLWLILTARSLASIPYVRFQVLRVRAQKQNKTLKPPLSTAYIGWICSLLLITAACSYGIAPKLSVLSLTLMGIRLFTAPKAAPPPAKVLGWREIAYGMMTVILTGIGIHLGW